MIAIKSKRWSAEYFGKHLTLLGVHLLLIKDVRLICFADLSLVRMLRQP